MTRGAIYKTQRRAQRQPLASQQATKIVGKFGGVRRLVRAMAQAGHLRNLSSVHRWMTAEGTNGIIPTSSALAVKDAAAKVGVLLTPGDWAL